jgi:hypothetical protein
VTSFLGGGVLRDAEGVGGLPEWIALGAFVAVGVLCVLILWPHKGWVWVVSATNLIEHHLNVEERNEPRKLYRFLAERLDGHHDANDERLGRLYVSFRWASVALGVEVVAWIVALRW